jgi:S-adenosylmethionine:tRNA ribosyltransferase-isomerase
VKTSDFYFDLPAERIAQYPRDRGESRLLLLDRAGGKRSHRAVKDLPGLLENGSLLVFNDSRVRKARVFGADSSGRKHEFLLLDPVQGGGDGSGSPVWQALAKKPSKKLSGLFKFRDGAEAVFETWEGGYTLRFDRNIDDGWFDMNGHIPLPPYIKRPDEGVDAERYQTVYARVCGSAAAPTAGLHFTKEMLSSLAEHGIDAAFITLHVGLGTFLPVRCADVEDHRMHTEHFFIGGAAADRIEAAKRDGRKVVAVGTTALRALESAADGEGRLRRGEQRTNIFIYGDYRFKTADALFTNFHTPESTLLMLVCAFAGAGRGGEAGRRLILETYREAIDNGYAFFSYGDAMLIV